MENTILARIVAIFTLHNVHIGLAAWAEDLEACIGVPFF